MSSTTKNGCEMSFNEDNEDGSSFYQTLHFIDVHALTLVGMRGYDLRDAGRKVYTIFQTRARATATTKQERHQNSHGDDNDNDSMRDRDNDDNEDTHDDGHYHENGGDMALVVRLATHILRLAMASISLGTGFFTVALVEFDGYDLTGFRRPVSTAFL